MPALVRLAIFGYPGWEADNNGDVYYDGRKVVGYEDDGYNYSFGRVKRAILVCTAWHGPKPSNKDLCAHKNDVRTDDSPNNIYWATFAENSQDAVRNGHYSGWHPFLEPTYEQRARGERLPLLTWLGSVDCSIRRTCA